MKIKVESVIKSYQAVLFFSCNFVHCDITPSKLKTMSNFTVRFEDGRTLQTVAYEIFGTGEHVVLIIPGAIGTAASDFPQQLSNDSSSEDCLDYLKFTFVAVELPGWGRSVPPERSFGPHTYRHDARCCLALMEHLNFHRRYSVVGWSDGAKVSLLIAHLLCNSQDYPHHQLRSLVLQGAISYESAPTSRRNISWSRNLGNWNGEQLKLYVAAYGGKQERVAQLWREHLDFIARFGEHFPHGLLDISSSDEGSWQAIETPTLLLHGDRDFFVEAEQANFLARRLPNCRLVRFEQGAHNLHQTEPARYKSLIEAFLAEH